MRRRPVLMTAAVVLCAAFLTGASAAASAGSGSAARTGASAAASPGSAAASRVAVRSVIWGTAIEIPGTNRLNRGGQDAVGALSCAASGNCSAGGSYTSGFNGRTPVVQAYVVNETKGVWRQAQQVPGAAALNTAGRARVNSISCSAPANCSAGGYYADAFDHQQAFVVSQTNGTWGNAQEVPGTAALDMGKPGAAVFSVSCASPGNCSAGGYYSDASGNQQAFVVNETNGAWGTAQQVPGTGALNAGGYAAIQSVSCPAPGTCSAGGYYASSSNGGIPVVQAFVVNEVGGTWGTAQQVPGTASLNGGGYSQVNSVSCASAGNCSAGGFATDSTPATQAFVVDEVGGTWGTAQQVPGIAALNQRKLAQVNSLSCASAGNCSAAGFYQDASFNNQAFVVDEVGGTWGTAQEIPGTAALDLGSPGATAVSVSCASAGNCSAGGSYSNAAGLQQAFIVTETNGTWANALQVPGTTVLSPGGLAGTQAVSCAPAGRCGAGGMYANAKMNVQVFVVNQTNGS